VVGCGLVGRAVAGPRCGLVAAALAAVYPGLWVWDGMLFSETMAQLTVVGVVLLAYRFWQRPSNGRALGLGVACGLAALSRSELVLTVPFIAVPIVMWRRELVLGRRLRAAALAVGAAAVTIGPWVAFNISRFEKPVYISSNFGPTLAAANCDATFYGDDVGYKSYPCAARAFELAERADPNWRDLDVSQQDAEVRARALRYVRGHLDRLPVVVAARWARVTGLHDRGQEVVADRLYYKRERELAEVTSWIWYGVVAGAVAGGLVLRRRRVPVFPLAAIPVIVLVSVAVTFGQSRYRAPAEVTLVVLTAVAVDAVGRRVPAGRT
jgi:4-amino-4-deoxy-L-arabinose transferase-like glycosyltransferase